MNDGAGTITTNNIGGDNTPAFYAKVGSNQTISDNTQTKIAFDTEVFDTNSAYDTSNYRFTVPTGHAGKYMINGAYAS